VFFSSATVFDHLPSSLFPILFNPRFSVSLSVIVLSFKRVCFWGLFFSGFDLKKQSPEGCF
jgi:hypothetical protein